MRVVLALAAVVVVSCYRAPLEGHACPCLDGFVCVDDVCIKPDPDAPNPSAACPTEPFLVGCTVAPPASAELVAVCDDGNVMPDALVLEMGVAALSPCLTSTDELDASFDPPTMSGSLAATDDGVALALGGSVTYDVDVPSECVTIGFDCDDLDGTCSDSGGDCSCAGVTVDHQVEAELFEDGAAFVTGTLRFIGCTVDGNYLLREHGTAMGGLGPILVFRPN